MSETTNLKLFKHDNPTTNTNQFDVEKSLNNNFDKIDEFAGNINEKNKDQDKQIEANKNEISKIKDENTNVNKEFVDKSKIIEDLLTELEDETIETEGNLTATNCAKAPAILEISGNYKQESREGRNRVKSIGETLPITIKSPATNYSRIDIFIDEEYLANYEEKGVTIKVKCKNPLQKAFTSFAFDTGWTIRKPFSEFASRIDNNGYTIYECYYKSNFQADTNRIVIIFEDTTQNTGCDLYDVEVDLGDTRGQDFEQYGASPSIDYPSEIKSCGDNVNLYNYKDLNLSSDATVDDDGWITLEYNNTSGNNKRYANYFTNISNQIKTNTKYLLVVEIKKVSGNGEVHFTSGPNAQIPAGVIENLSNLTNNSIKIYNVTSINSFSDITILLRTYLQLETGQNGSITFRISLLEDVTITANNFVYLPYNTGNINFTIRNKNLYNYKNVKSSNDATTDNEGWITLNLDNTSGNNRKFANYHTNISNQIKTNTKYLLVVEIKKVSGNGEIRFTSGIDAQFPITGVENLSNLTNNSIKIYNVTSINSFSDITILLRTYLQLEPGQGGSITFRISLLEDTTITTETFIYTSYQEQNYTIPTQKPFRKIGEYADTFIKKDGRWYEKHFGDRYIFTGNENINKHNTVANNLYYINPSKNPIANKMYVPLNNNELVNIKCNCFKAQSVLDMVNANLSGIGLSMQKDIYIGTTLEGINTPEKLNEKLKELYDLGNPMYIDYPLKEPELIECTEEQIQILEELSKLETYYEVTNIISEDEIKPNFKLTYKLSNRLKQKELEERVSALESLLVNQENINQIESIEEQDVE